MAWRVKIATLAGSALLSATFYATDFVQKFENCSTVLYLAGQFKFAIGDREAGLDLMSRATTNAHSERETAKPAPSSEPKTEICTKDRPPINRQQPQKRASMPSAMTFAKVNVRYTPPLLPQTPNPHVLLASLNVPVPVAPAVPSREDIAQLQRFEMQKAHQQMDLVKKELMKDRELQRLIVMKKG